jgi:hypothetical protein
VTAAEREATSSVSSPVRLVETTAPVMDTTAPALGVGPAWPVSPGASARAAPLVRLQAAAAQLVPQAQYHIARLGVLGQAGLAALTAAAVLAAGALLPAQHALQNLSAELARAKDASVASSADQGAPRLLASLPTRAQIPEVIGKVFAQAKEAGVSLDTGHYVYTPAKGGAVARYELEFPVKASYPDIRSFIDRTLSAVPAAALGKLRVERKAVGDTVVGGDIVFVVFVRSGDQP